MGEVFEPLAELAVADVEDVECIVHWRAGAGLPLHVERDADGAGLKHYGHDGLVVDAERDDACGVEGS